MDDTHTLDGPAKPTAGPLAGFTVGVTAARRADELIALLRRRGATVLHAPALRIVPLADDSELLAATKDLIHCAPDTVVATTAIGFRGWIEAADGWGIGEELLARLRAAELLARGPKVKGAVRAAGLVETWSPDSESLAEVLDRMLAAGVAGRRIALQLHGEPLPGFVEALRAGGAEVVVVPVYRWMAPEDLGPLDRLLDAVAVGAVDAVSFTSAPAAASLLTRAEQRGCGRRCWRGFGGRAVGVRGTGDGAAAAGGRGGHRAARAVPAGTAGTAAVPGTAGTGPGAARGGTPGGDPGARGARGRGAAARAAGRDGPAAGTGAQARMGGGAVGAAAGAAGGGAGRARRRDGDGAAAGGAGGSEPHPDGGEAGVPVGAGRGRMR